MQHVSAADVGRRDANELGQLGVECRLVAFASDIAHSSGKLGSYRVRQSRLRTACRWSQSADVGSSYCQLLPRKACCVKLRQTPQLFLDTDPVACFVHGPPRNSEVFRGVPGCKTAPGLHIRSVSRSCLGKQASLRAFYPPARLMGQSPCQKCRFILQSSLDDGASRMSQARLVPAVGLL